MAIAKTISGPYGLNPSYFRITGYQAALSERALKIFVGAYMNREAREENALPIPLMPMEVMYGADDGFKDGFTIAELYEFLMTKEIFKGAAFDKNEQPEVEKYPTIQRPPEPAGTSPEYDAAQAAANDAPPEVPFVATVEHPGEVASE